MVFFYFHYGFRSSRPIADLRTVVFNRIARALTGPGLIEQQQLIYPRYLTEIAVLFHKLKSYGISGQTMIMMRMNCFSGMVDHQRHLALFPARTYSRDLHNLKSPKRCEQNLNVCRICVQTLLNEVVK